MNNEEKILALLEAVQGDIKEMRGDITDMKGDISEMQTVLTKVAVTQEGVVLPKIQLLFEGHSLLAEKMDGLTSREKAEELEDRVDMLEGAVKVMRPEIDKLKKAL